MLHISGSPYQHCDGLSRRDFLVAGSLGLGGLTLADVLRAESVTGSNSRPKSIINVHLDGGPPQMDMIDPKPLAPVELRGEFAPISTTMPELQLTEMLPRLAQQANDWTFLRSLVGSAGRHDAFQCQSGFKMQDLQSLGGRPAMGGVLTKLLGSADDIAPTFVDLMQGRPLVRDSSRPGFLGPSYKAFRPDLSHLFKRELEPGMVNELARQGANHRTELKLNTFLNANRLHSRTELLSGLDRIKRDVDATGMMNAMDRFHQQAVGILTSGRFADALDLSQESPEELARWKLPSSIKYEQHTTSDGPNAPLKLLLARRLIEAGVRCVSVSISDFDTHSGNFPRMKSVLPLVDHALSMLITDLKERGLHEDVAIVVWGEFGRTPRINDKGGRDHWPRLSMGLLSGGGMKTGQIIGSTDRTASTAFTRPVHFKDVFATLYHLLGIDPHQVTLTDPTGRPQYLLDEGTVIREVV